MFDHEKLIAFVDGFVTDEPDLYDEMYEKASLHNPQGAWQMIFGVNTLPSYRCQGYAGQLIQYAIDTCLLYTSIPWFVSKNKCSFCFYAIHLPPVEEGEFLLYYVKNGTKYSRCV